MIKDLIMYLGCSLPLIILTYVGALPEIFLPSAILLWILVELVGIKHKLK